MRLYICITLYVFIYGFMAIITLKYLSFLDLEWLALYKDLWNVPVFSFDHLLSLARLFVYVDLAFKKN